MKSIEDCIETLDSMVAKFSFAPSPASLLAQEVISDWDQKFIASVCSHTRIGSALSSAQGEIAIKILRKYVELFPGSDQPSVERLIATPHYRKPFFKSISVAREVRWTGGTTLLFRFQYNDGLLSQLKILPTEMDELTPKYPIKGQKMWRITVDNSNHKEIMRFIQNHNFGFDDDVLRMFMNIENNLDKKSEIRVVDGEIQVDINNDVMAALWLRDMEWLKNV